MESNISVIHADEGKRLGVAGGNYRIIVSGDETDGNYAVVEMIVPPGGGPPPHSHPHTQGMFIFWIKKVVIPYEEIFSMSYPQLKK